MSAMERVCAYWCGVQEGGAERRQRREGGQSLTGKERGWGRTTTAVDDGIQRHKGTKEGAQLEGKESPALNNRYKRSRRGEKRGRPCLNDGGLEEPENEEGGPR